MKEKNSPDNFANQQFQTRDRNFRKMIEVGQISAYVLFNL